jgi:hypothetical protein
MPYRIALIERDAIVNAFTALFNKGANPSTSFINIYSNATSQPATPETAVPGGSVLLAQIPFSSAAFAASAGSTGVANALSLHAPVINTGTASWFRCFTGASTPAALADGSVTLAAASGDMIFDNVNFISGASVVLSNFAVWEPM